MINILLAIAAYGIFHSLTASPPFKRLMRRWMGAAYHRSYRLIYNFFSVVTLIPILLTVRLHPGLRLYQLALPWTLATTALQLAGLLIVVFGLIQTGPFQFMGLRQLFGSSRQDEEVLAISELHGWVRHPLYTGGLLFIWATPIMTTGILALNLGLSAYILIGSHFEEKRLATEFGDRYRSYQEKVPRLIPRPWKRA